MAAPRTSRAPGKGSLSRAFSRWLERFLGLERVREIAIRESVVRDLCAMARSAHPKEMLAFLSARKGVRDGRLVIDEIQLQAYDADEDSASVQLHNLPAHTSIVGTVHSHPGASARPSDADLHLFSQFGLVHAIIKEPYRMDDIVFYDKRGRRVRVERLASNARLRKPAGRAAPTPTASGPGRSLR